MADKSKEALKQAMLLMAETEKEKQSPENSKSKNKEKESPEEKNRKKERRKKMKAKAKIMAGKVIKTVGKMMKVAAKGLKAAANAMKKAAQAMVRTATNLIQAAASTGPAAIVALPAAIAIAVPMYAAAAAMMATSVALTAASVVMSKAGAALEKTGAKIENSGRQEIQQANTAESNSATITQSHDNNLSDLNGKSDSEQKKDDKINIMEAIDNFATAYLIADTVKDVVDANKKEPTPTASQQEETPRQRQDVAQQMRLDSKHAQQYQNHTLAVLQNQPENAPQNQLADNQQTSFQPQNMQIFSAMRSPDRHF